MSPLTFDPVSGGLYSAVGGGPSAAAIYWVVLEGTPPAGNLDPAVTWSNSGCHVMVPAAATISDPAGFVAAVQKFCGPAQANARGLAWVTDPTSVATTIVGVTGV